MSRLDTSLRRWYALTSTRVLDVSTSVWKPWREETVAGANCGHRVQRGMVLQLRGKSLLRGSNVIDFLSCWLLAPHDHEQGIDCCRQSEGLKGACETSLLWGKRADTQRFHRGPSMVDS